MIARTLTLVLILAAGSYSLSLQEAKQSGRVCEVGNGYVQAKDGSPEAQSVVDSTNAKRSQKYAEIAARNGTAVEAVAAEAAATLGSDCN